MIVEVSKEITNSINVGDIIRFDRVSLFYLVTQMNGVYFLQNLNGHSSYGRFLSLKALEEDLRDVDKTIFPKGQYKITIKRKEEQK